MNKPTLTRDQSDALHEVLKLHDPATALRIHADTPYGWCGKYVALRDLDVLVLSAALVNGWETEKSPIDILREDFREKRSGGSMDRAWCSGVIIALGATGQAIEGINA